LVHVLVDTCVWLDLAKDTRQAAVIGVVEQMIQQKLVALVVPRLVLEEFGRNRARIATESAKSMSSHFRLVKDAIDRVGGDKRRTRAVLRHLDDVNQKLPLVGGTVSNVLDQIERMLEATPLLEPSDAAKLKAAQRAVDKRAPFHRDRNSMADALLIEMYSEYIRANTAAGQRFAFVTHNKNDFSLVNGNHKLPHPDLADRFSRIKSRYFINLPELLHRIDPTLVSDVMLEQSWTQEPRGLTEILEAEDLFSSQVWYDRHSGMASRVKEGSTKIVDKETYPRPRGGPDTIQRDIWQAALKAAKRTERRYGKKNLGPWTDFEWGMINGKLSALRWALGDEWDMLDT